MAMKIKVNYDEKRIVNQAGCGNPNCKVCYPFGKNILKALGSKRLKPI